MPDTKDLKLFISWSGPLSKSVATALHKWIREVMDGVEPFMSDVDIAKGERGLAKIEEELIGTDFGIIVVTRENRDAVWINFEAGAMSKQVDDATVRVAPLLINMDRISDLQGPMGQFQVTLFNKEDVTKLMQSLGQVAGRDKEIVARRVDRAWSELARAVEMATVDAGHDEAEIEPPSQQVILDEILNHVRAMRADSGRRTGGLRIFGTAVGHAPPVKAHVPGVPTAWAPLIEPLYESYTFLQRSRLEFEPKDDGAHHLTVFVPEEPSDEELQSFIQSWHDLDSRMTYELVVGET